MGLTAPSARKPGMAARQYKAPLKSEHSVYTLLTMQCMYIQVSAPKYAESV